MGLPKIKTYPMPSPGEFPKNRVGWRIEPGRCFLLIHDMQTYFLNAYAREEPPIVDLVANINLLRRQCAIHKIPVFYSVQPGAQSPRERGLLQDFWGSGIGAGPDTKIVDPVAPGEDDIMVKKRRYSAFYDTSLPGVLRSCGRDQMIICGVYAHIGVMATCSEAFMNDIKPFMIGDAVADFSPADHTMALGYIASCSGMVLSTAQVVEMLENPGTQKPAGAT